MNEDLTLGNLAESLRQKKNEYKVESQEIKKESLIDFKERLTEYMDNELSTIEEDMTRRSKNLQKKLFEIRKEIHKEEKQFIQTLQEEREGIEEEIIHLSDSLTNIRVKQWIIPSLIGVSIVLGLGIGSLVLGKWISSQYQEIENLASKIEVQKKELEKIEKTKGKYIVKAWDNAMGVKNEPKVWRDVKENLWIVQFEKSKGE